MGKTAFLFPGQGSQSIGMAKELFDNFSCAKNIILNANDVLGFDLKKLMFEGPDEELRMTRVTQPAVFIASLAAYSVLAEKKQFNEKDVLSAGHSLGEYSAFACSGAFSLEDGLKMVKRRGEFIQDASSENPGIMAAIMGLDKEIVIEISKAAASSTNSVCEPVNFNSPGQVVIAGNIAGVEKASVLAKEKGALKVIRLNVSGPFHSTLMTSASIKMEAELSRYEFNDTKFPVIANFDSAPVSSGGQIKTKLVKQINNPVLWEDTIKYMIAGGADTFIEIGPGRVLSGLMRRIDKSKKVYNIEDIKSLDKITQALI